MKLQSENGHLYTKRRACTALRGLAVKVILSGRFKSTAHDLQRTFKVAVNIPRNVETKSFDMSYSHLFLLWSKLDRLRSTRHCSNFACSSKDRFPRVCIICYMRYMLACRFPMIHRLFAKNMCFHVGLQNLSCTWSKENRRGKSGKSQCCRKWQSLRSHASHENTDTSREMRNYLFRDGFGSKSKPFQDHRSCQLLL